MIKDVFLVKDIETPYETNLIECVLHNIVLYYTYDQSSKSNDRTLDMCEPKFLWIPEHSIHISTPKLRLAQSGSKIKRDVIYVI